MQLALIPLTSRPVRINACEHCGEDAGLHQRTGKPRRFCSFECNSRFNKKRKQAQKNKGKKCEWCGKINHRTNSKYCADACRQEFRDAKARERKWQTNPDKRQPNLDTCKCCGTDISDKPFTIFCSIVCAKRWYRHPIKRTEPLQRGKKPISEKTYIKLAQQNARQAWQYWLKEKSPDWWVGRYYEAMGKPWLNPRLSDSEKYRLQYRLDEQYAISERLRRQITKARKRDGVSEIIRGAIRRNGASALIKKEFGYSIEELKQHLELQFTRGMNWEKFKQGKIHIDHIVPQKEFDLSDDEQWRKCWCLSNLRPMWARDNIRKGARLEVLL